MFKIYAYKLTIHREANSLIDLKSYLLRFKMA